MKVAVAIPTYNKKDNISAIIREIFRLDIEGLGIVVVDDNSPDGTGDIVKNIAQADSRVHLMSRERKLGLGTAYVAGFRQALELGAEYIFEIDADFSHDPCMIPEFLAGLQKNDLVIGSRYLDGISIANWPLHRLALSYFSNHYARMVTGMKTKDLTSGFKGYRRAVLEAIDFERVKSNGYSFQIEMKYRAEKKDFHSSKFR
jgi:dolichol-phosphate mannosyltransferase